MLLGLVLRIELYQEAAKIGLALRAQVGASCGRYCCLLELATLLGLSAEQKSSAQKSCKL